MDAALLGPSIADNMDVFAALALENNMRGEPQHVWNLLDDDLDVATHRVAQQIGRAQSAMLRQASVFQRALNQLDRHRVHLGASGLSSSDVNRFLRDCTIDSLAELATDALTLSPQPAFVLGPIALDIAEYELVGAIEADVGNGRVSINAPVGRALVGRRAGERVEVVTPGGTSSLEVLDVGVQVPEAA